MKRTRKAFTLIELLLVIAIIAVIGAGSVAMARFDSTRQSLTAAQQTLMSAFEEARIIATSKNARSRVVIYKGNDPSRKLRQVGILYEAYDENGENMGWIAAGMPVTLPKSTFFMPPKGEFRSHISLPPKNTPDAINEVDVINSTFNNGTTGAARVVGVDEFSRIPRSMGEGNGDWYSYEFSPEGLSENPSAVIVIASGTTSGDNTILLKNPYEIKGFVVYRTGRTVAFNEYDQIKGNIRGN